MPYYPKSQVRTGLYTNNEYTLAASGEGYQGDYWITSRGEAYTGKSPLDPSARLLVKAPPRDQTGYAIGGVGQDEVQTQIMNSTYANLKNYDLQNPPSPPIANPNFPTQNDYTVGEFRRYFCKKANDVVYLELNKDTFEKLGRRDPTILWELYPAFDIPWLLVGEAENVFNVNRRITELLIKQKNLIGFAQFLKNDYLKYYKG
jgi:hypothetical protein